MHITAKPTSFTCNLNCEYCFYLSKEPLFKDNKWMSYEVLENFIIKYVESSGPDVYFTWQGGEPTMIGLDFFEQAVLLQQKHQGSKRIHNAIQTNGILLNDKWCSFLKQHHFLVGISIDGPKELHDQYRVTRSGNGSFDKVLQAITLLKQHEVEFNTLTVINKLNGKYPLEVYAFLKSIGSRHIQFIELLETKNANSDFSSCTGDFEIIDFSVPSDVYGDFMVAIFREWVRHDVGTIFIRQFDSFLSCFVGNGHTSCVFQESCKDNFIIESNGDIYECDHFVYPQYKIGNIAKNPLKSLHSTQLTKQKTVLSDDCLACEYKQICNGGCPKHRITKTSSINKSYFCHGYKKLFTEMTPYMNAMAQLIKHGVEPKHIMDIAGEIEKNLS